MEAVTATLGGDFRPSMGGLPLGSPDQIRRDVIVTKLRLAAKEQGLPAGQLTLELVHFSANLPHFCLDDLVGLLVTQQ